MGNDLIYGGAGDDTLVGGLTTNPGTLSDGNDTILGGGGKDYVNGGNGDNLLDAGDDGIRESIIGGNGADWYYTHKISSSFKSKYADIGSVGSGKNRAFTSGGLVEPPLPAPAFQTSLVVSIPISAYTGQIKVKGIVKPQPVESQIPGHQKGFIPPFNTTAMTTRIR